MEDITVKDKADEMEYYLADFSANNPNMETHAVQYIAGRLLVKAEDIPHAYQIVKDYCARDFVNISITRVVKPEVKNNDQQPST